MQHIFIPLITITFTSILVIQGCGLMNNTKDDPTETKRIHVPQKITVEIPNALKVNNTQENQKTKYPKWYK